MNELLYMYYNKMLLSFDNTFELLGDLRFLLIAYLLIRGFFASLEDFSSFLDYLRRDK